MSGYCTFTATDRPSRSTARCTWASDAEARGVFSNALKIASNPEDEAHAHYLLAMKCAAMRLGEEFHDLDDVRYLLRHLDISSVDDALAVVGRYFDDAQLRPKTRLALEELLGQ